MLQIGFRHGAGFQLVFFSMMNKMALERESWKDEFDRKFDLIFLDGTIEDLDKANLVVTSGIEKFDDLIKRRKEEIKRITGGEKQ